MHESEFPMKEYKDLIQEMYDRINDFVARRPGIEAELFERQRDFYRLAWSDQNKGMLFFDWFIFDYRLEKSRKRLFDLFLADQKKKISHELYDRYAAVGHDCFGFFKIKAVKMGLEFLCEDAVTSTEYHVYETTLTKYINKGDYIIGRLLPFDDAFVTASQCLRFEKQNYDVLALLLKGRSGMRQQRIDAFEVYKVLFPQPIPEKLSVEEKFILLCKEGGLSDDQIEDVCLQIRMSIKDRSASPQQLMKDLIGKFSAPEYFSLKEFADSFIDMWNHFVGEIHPAMAKGPVERMMLHVCTEALEDKFPLPDHPSEKELRALEKRIDQWTDQWFVTPLKELNGKTPKEVILEERKAMGNPQEEFGFDFRVDEMSEDPFMERKAQKLADEAAEYMTNEEYQKALESYEEYLKLWDENHVVWHNMGVCYAMLLQKRKAQECFQMAWTIKPDYELAYKKWDQLTSMNKAEMTAMIREMKRRKKT